MEKVSFSRNENDLMGICVDPSISSSFLIIGIGLVIGLVIGLWRFIL